MKAYLVVPEGATVTRYGGYAAEWTEIRIPAGEYLLEPVTVEWHPVRDGGRPYYYRADIVGTVVNAWYGTQAKAGDPATYLYAPYGYEVEDGKATLWDGREYRGYWRVEQ